MSKLAATYRLQLRSGLTFADAAGVVPYLARLGVSHLYLSPIFAAAPGSTHGYDVIDCNAVAPELGGEAGLGALCQALRRHGVGLVVDFVPNHMAATPANPWWRDVLEWGERSPFAGHFDIDWSAPGLLLPVLGESFATLAARGELGLALEPDRGEIELTYADHRFPLAPASYAEVLRAAGGAIGGRLARAFALVTRDGAPALKRQLAAASADSTARAALEAALARLGRDPRALAALHDGQVWRLARWRLAREALTYRRFFEITELVGLNVERPAVFDDVHRRLLELARAGEIDAIRLDHIDGLADPKAYLERLRAALAERAPVILLVEKILEAHETLRPDWPVAGTTGYEVGARLAGLLVDGRHAAALTEAYHAFIGRTVDYPALVACCKRTILTVNLAGELAGLTRMAAGLCAREPGHGDTGSDALREAIVALMMGLDVYRTYVDLDGAGPEDRAVIAVAAAKVRAFRRVEDEAALEAIQRFLTLDCTGAAGEAAALRFTRRFQQTSGPVMAKALEDTAFYRYNRLVALNEVGGEPDRVGLAPGDFHRAMTERLRQQPGGLSATATHDTKRGEDARMRIAVISECPGDWARHVARWDDLLGPLVGDSRGQPAPSREARWLFFQALLGVWPPDLSPLDAGGVEALAGRMSAFMLKAAREAKAETSWTLTDADYEQALEAFVAGALDRRRAAPFLDDLVATCRPLWVTGALNSLAQTLLKLTVPGVPDIYQGTEAWDLSLVDPDNRRSVDFSALDRSLGQATREAPAATLAAWPTALPKMLLTARGLGLRLRQPALFEAGAYQPLDVAGPLAEHAVAFARRAGRGAVVVVVPRLCHALLDGAAEPLVPPARWERTHVRLADGLQDCRWTDEVTGETLAAGDRLRLDVALAGFPVALLTGETA